MAAVRQTAPGLPHDRFVGSATRFDFYASLVAGVVALLVGGMILVDVTFLDLGRDEAGMHGTPIARIESSRNVVRKKSSDLPLWNLASQNDILYADDYVFTDKESSAHLQFVDQDEIILDQNTMIQVRRLEGEASLGLLKGTLRAEGKGAAKPLVIQVGETGTVLRAAAGTRFNVRARSDGKSAIAVLSGQAEIQRGDVKVVLEAAEAAVTDATGTVVKEEGRRVLLDRPADGERLSLAPAEAATFTWATPAETPRVWFELARDGDFTNLVTSQETSASSLSLSDLADGTYHWRVRADEPSVVRTITIARRAPPDLLWPEQGARVEAGATPVMLMWKGEEEAHEFLVELTTDPDLLHSLAKGTTSEASFATPALVEGTYYWRVKEHEGGAWSAVRSFTVGAVPQEAPPQEIEEEVLPPPALDEQYEIIVPKKGAFRWESLLGVGVAYASDDEAPVMRWPAVKDASAYAVQISQDETFTTIHREADVLAAFYSFEGFEPGIYFIRIATRNSRGVKGAFSKPVRVVISHPAPRLVAPRDGQQVEHGVAVTFDWRRVEGAKSYRVEIARDAAFKMIARTETPPLSSVEVRGAEAGSYFWRVSAVFKDEQSGPFSRVGRFTVAAPQVAPPVASKPAAPSVETSPVPPTSETTTASVVASAEPARPVAKRTFSFGASPTQLTYEGERRAPAIDLDATLFNSFFLSAATVLSPRWALDLSARRTATELFSDDAPQEPVKMTPIAASLAGVIRISPGEAPNWWGVRVGVGHQTLPRFSEDAARLVSVRHVSIVEPLLGLSGEWGQNARWRWRGSLDYFPVMKTSHVTDGARWSGEVSLLQVFSSSPYFAQYGARMERARYALSNAAGGGDLTSASRSFLIGLGIQY